MIFSALTAAAQEIPDQLRHASAIQITSGGVPVLAQRDSPKAPAQIVVETASALAGLNKYMITSNADRADLHLVVAVEPVQKSAADNLQTWSLRWELRQVPGDALLWTLEVPLHSDRFAFNPQSDTISEKGIRRAAKELAGQLDSLASGTIPVRKRRWNE